MARTKSYKTLLRDLYDACLGVTSERDVFDRFYEGGTDKFLDDFGLVLKELKISSLMSRQSKQNTIKSIILSKVKDLKDYLINRGLNISDYPNENYDGYNGFILTGPQFHTAKIRCPLCFQNWNDASTIGFIIEINEPNLKLDDVSFIVDEMTDLFKNVGLVKPRVKLDPGPGIGRSAWFVRFEISR